MGKALGFDVAQVRVGRDEYLAVEEGGLGEDEGVVALGGRDDALFEKFAGDGGGVCFLEVGKGHGGEAPFASDVAQRASGLFTPWGVGGFLRKPD